MSGAGSKSSCAVRLRESDRDGDHEIYTMRADGGDVVQLTDNEIGDVSPAWSPDGTRITFERVFDSDPELIVIDADDGSNVIRLTRNGSVDASPSWRAS